MTDQKTLFEKADGIRHRLVSVVKQLTDTGRKYELPPPSEQLTDLVKRLEENTYQVLVIGEAKRGKSSLVNALIGESLLPTNVDIATSQVFRIQPSDKRAAQLRFEDDSTRPIDINELARYGSQVLADVEGVPRLDRIIRWIEMETPCHFIPPNIRLLDTPGLGALYAHHSQITRRFIPYSDAVVFVLESQAPISEPELEILEEVVKVTRNVFFVQTKIDQFRREEWENIRKRNEEILKSRFEDRLEDLRVWPVSTSNLMKAAQTGDEDYELISRGRELIAALQEFLFKVAGITRAAIVVGEAQPYYAEGRGILVQRLQSTRDSGADIERSLAELERRRGQLESQWGPAGSSRKKAMAKIREGVRLAENELRTAIRGIQQETMGRLQAETSLHELNSLRDNLPQEISRKISQAWEKVCEEFQDYCQRQMTPLANDLRDLSTVVKSNDTEVMPIATPSYMRAHSREDGFGNMIHAFIKEGVKPGAIGVGLWYLSTFSSLPLLGAIFSPLFPIGLGFLGFGIFKTITAYGERQKQAAEQVKEEVVKQIKVLFSEINEQLFEPSFSGLRLRELLEQFVNKIEEKIDDVVRERLESLAKEIDDMKETLQLTTREKGEKAREIENRIEKWDHFGGKLNTIAGELAELGKSPGQGSPEV
jgi:GTPase SAR1 family protein